MREDKKGRGPQPGNRGNDHQLRTYANTPRMSRKMAERCVHHYLDLLHKHGVNAINRQAALVALGEWLFAFYAQETF